MRIPFLGRVEFWGFTTCSSSLYLGALCSHTAQREGRDHVKEGPRLGEEGAAQKVQRAIDLPIFLGRGRGRRIVSARQPQPTVSSWMSQLLAEEDYRLMFENESRGRTETGP